MTRLYFIEHYADETEEVEGDICPDVGLIDDELVWNGETDRPWVNWRVICGSDGRVVTVAE